MALKVLAIDHSESALKKLARALTLQNFEVTSCTSHDDALKKIRDQPYDAVLLASEMALESKAIFKQFSREQRPGMPVIEINGSIDHLVEEIKAALMDR